MEILINNFNYYKLNALNAKSFKTNSFLNFKDSTSVFYIRLKKKFKTKHLSRK